MAPRVALSVAVITLNEERNLDRCLGSVAWADELVVVDSGSTDRTLEIAEARRATVVSQPWLGYVAQKNLALERASNRWVLSLDADEWLSERGAREVRRVLESPSAEAYAFDRLSAFVGGFLRRTWRPDWHVRLFLKDRGRFVGGRVHERVRMDPGCRVERLREPLLHLSYHSYRDFLDRMNRYTDLDAATMRERGKRFSLAKLVFSPPAAFLKFYVLRRGFLDGTRGFMVSVGSAYYTFLKHAKLWETDAPEDPRFEAALREAAGGELPRKASPGPDSQSS